MRSFHFEKTTFPVNKLFLLRISKQCVNPRGRSRAVNNEVSVAEARVVTNPCPWAGPQAGKAWVPLALLALDNPVWQLAAPRAALGCMTEGDVLPAAGNYSPLGLEAASSSTKADDFSHFRPGSAPFWSRFPSCSVLLGVRKLQSSCNSVQAVGDRLQRGVAWSPPLLLPAAPGKWDPGRLAVATFLHPCLAPCLDPAALHEQGKKL